MAFLKELFENINFGEKNQQTAQEYGKLPNMQGVLDSIFNPSYPPPLKNNCNINLFYNKCIEIKKKMAIF